MQWRRDEKNKISADFEHHVILSNTDTSLIWIVSVTTFHAAFENMDLPKIGNSGLMSNSLRRDLSRDAKLYWLLIGMAGEQ